MAHGLMLGEGYARRMLGICGTVAAMLLSVAPAYAQRGTPVPAAPPPAAASTDPLERLNESIDALTRKVWPSVVQILVTSYGARAEGPRADASVVVGRQRSVGSGFVIDAEGYIMTNAHVVDGAQRVEIVIPPANADGRLSSALAGRTNVVPARVIGTTSELDLALLKVDNAKLVALPLATYSQVRQGETVFAFGSPSGLRNTLTHGLVSAVARQIDPDSPQIFIQTDAPINPGNSGGPLVNTRGEVVGVNTFILSQSGGNEGLGFAIPSATVRTVFRQLKQYGQLRRQEIGVSLQTITPAMATGLGLARDFGVIVSDVWPGGPAEAAGMQVGDVLVEVDGQPANDLPSVNYMFRLRDSPDRVPITVSRGTAQFRFSVAAVEDRNEFDSVASMADAQKNIVRELGILGVEIDAKIAAQARGLRSPNGVIVAARVTGATAEVPLVARDVIRSVNGKPVTTLQSLRDAFRGMAVGTPVVLQIQREGRLMYVAFTFE
jgi:serine protease Do